MPDIYRKQEQKPGQSVDAAPDVAEVGAKGQTREPIPAQKPSQAEGDRETIEQDLREKEAEGQI